MACFTKYLLHKIIFATRTVSGFDHSTSHNLRILRHSLEQNSAPLSSRRLRVRWRGSLTGLMTCTSTGEKAVVAWAATALGPILKEVEIANYFPQACWRKSEVLTLISHYCELALSLTDTAIWFISFMFLCYQYR